MTQVVVKDVSAKMRPRSKLLRWAGSKTQSESSIKPFLAFDKNYIEPFCGSASFFFSNAPESATLNDSNRELINFYQRLQKQPKRMFKLYNALDVSKETYYIVREKFNDKTQSATNRAAYFLYLNHFCFNGIYRTNQSGGFNTPYGANTKPKTKLKESELIYFSDMVQKASFHCMDFEECLNLVKPVGSCIYMDPPYFTKDDRVFGEYGASIFNKSDLQRLRDLSLSLSANNRVVLTYKDCSEFRELFSENIVSTIPITRNVGGFAGRRKRDLELIAVMGNA